MSAQAWEWSVENRGIGRWKRRGRWWKEDEIREERGRKCTK
jgi:hypothetical protein